jgi:hypothetical protein
MEERERERERESGTPGSDHIDDREVQSKTVFSG